MCLIHGLNKIFYLFIHIFPSPSYSWERILILLFYYVWHFMFKKFQLKHVQLYIGIECCILSCCKSSQWFKLNIDLYWLIITDCQLNKYQTLKQQSEAWKHSKISQWFSREASSWLPCHILQPELLKGVRIFPPQKNTT